MANKSNLIPQQHKLTVDEQSKGGKKSVKSKKQKKYIKEMLEELLLMDLPECKLNEDMQKLGICKDDISIQMAMCVMLVKQAVYGNLKAYQLIRDQIDQNPKDGVVEPLQNIYFINDLYKPKKEETEKIKEK